jgi:hypothetical protein
MELHRQARITGYLIHDPKSSFGLTKTVSMNYWQVR